MPTIVKIILFLVINAAGAFAVPFLYNLAIMMDILPTGELSDLKSPFYQWLGAALLVWGLCALISLRYFFVAEEKQTLDLLLLPLYGPLIYGASVLIYFIAT